MATTNIPQQLYKFELTVDGYDISDTMYVQKQNISIPSADEIPGQQLFGNKVHQGTVLKHPEEVTMTIIETNGFKVFKQILQWIQKCYPNPITGEYPNNPPKQTITLTLPKTDNSGNYKYVFESCFPKSLPSISLDKTTGNFQEPMDFTFSTDTMSVVMTE